MPASEPGPPSRLARSRPVLIPWEQLATAAIPGGGELRLMRRGDELSIMSGAIELMNSRLSGSEVQLAQLTLTRLGDRSELRLLIGGLGMGFTLRAALAGTRPDAVLTVAELVPAVVDWARGLMSRLFEGCLGDPRVDVRIGDVADLIAARPAAFDAILLDVDNGPGGLNRAENDHLYTTAGLAAAKRALRPAGLLAVWSASHDEGFVRRLRSCGFAVGGAPPDLDARQTGATPA